MARILFTASLVYVAVVATAFASAGTSPPPATYYVSPSGNDSASGTSASSPWRSINRVNEQKLQAGSTVLFLGGATFAGEIYLAPGESGTSSAPITFGSYGGGQATISGGSGSALFVYDAAGVVVQNLAFVGSGASTSTADGLAFYNDLAGNVKLSYVRITSISVSGFGHYGISIGGWNGSSGFRDVQLTHANVHDNRRGGVSTYGPPLQPTAPTYANSNVYVGHVSAYDNLGDPTLSSNSGNGIVLGSVSGATIERSVAHDNGSQCHANECGVGIWAYDSTNVVIQRNESYSNKTGSSVDGDGFDLDQNTSHSTVQYNYSHGNDGAGYLMYTAQSNSLWSGNTVRYNISENDGRKNSYASIEGGGKISNSAVYNNTVFLSPSASGTPSAVRFLSAGSGDTLRNNIFFATSGLPMVTMPAASPTSILFQQNDYYSPVGQFKVVVGPKSYTSLAAWQSATGQERLNGSPTGAVANPLLTSPGNGGTVGNADNLTSLAAYVLLPTTPLLDRGLDLTKLFGIDIGGQDFYGVPIPSGNGPELGASEVPVS